MPITILLVIATLISSIIIIVLLVRGSSRNNGSDTLKNELARFTAELTRVDQLIRDEFSRSRLELGHSLKSFEDRFSQNVKDLNELQRQKFGDLATKQEQFRLETESKLERIRTTTELSLEKSRSTSEENLQKVRLTMDSGLEKTRSTLEDNMQKTRETVETKLKALQEDNAKKLEEMRATVDEKLQSTVEKRFNDSFKLISDRLEQVHKGLGEMQTLASGVGDLKKVLTNVKTRGNMGEIQLGAILEEIFSPDHYEHNAIVRADSQERVEYVIKLPNKNSDNQSLLLPIDSKFPNEDYQRLLEAYENIADLDPRQVDSIAKAFEGAVKKSAKDIRDKYINPPTTTDFAILFVPTEGLYAEILRRAGLFETLRRDFKVTVVGPTNLVAFLNSLQMGFRTLAIERRSSEVWEILGAVKTEFGNFSVILDRTRKKLQEATNTIDKAGVRTRAIERQLRKVQELPQEHASALLGQALDMEAEQIQDEDREEEQ